MWPSSYPRAVVISGLMGAGRP